jgi:hypothetical protein
MGESSVESICEEAADVEMGVLNESAVIRQAMTGMANMGRE